MRTGGGGIKRQGRRARYVTVRPCEWAFRSAEVGAARWKLGLNPNPLKKKRVIHSLRRGLSYVVPVKYRDITAALKHRPNILPLTKHRHVTKKRGPCEGRRWRGRSGVM